MAKERLSMRKTKEILRLRWCCLSGYSTANLSRYFVIAPGPCSGLRDRVGAGALMRQSERPARA
jgi:hypothetical protein